MRVVGVLMALGLTLVSYFANSVQTVQDQRKVANMMSKMKTVCVGRFLLDIPAGAALNIDRGFVSGYDISTSTHETDEEFATRLRQFEAEVSSARKENGRPSLESSKVLAFGPGRGKVFVHSRRRGKTLENDRIVMTESVSVRGMLRFPGLSITASAEGMDFDSGAELARLLGRIRPLATGEIPAESGFCLDHAIVRDPYPDPEGESAVMFAGFLGHPDVSIVLSTMAGTAPAPGLLARNAAAAEREPLFMRLAFTNLRERSRTINGLPGEELLLRIRETNFTTGYDFQWEMAGNEDDILAPLLTLELGAGTNPVSGGKPVQSSLSEEVLLELWERMSSSIRIRPSASAKGAQSAPLPVALGTSSLAGEICPETGWWQCGDGGNGVGVFGGERQFLKKGQRMPQALLLPPATLWQRLRGMQPSYETRNPTLWTLADKRSSARIPPPAGLAHALPGVDRGVVPAAATPGASIEAPIGSIAKTGAACPASGWWRCEDSHALDGTRWFAAGSVLPAATFRPQGHGRGAGHPELIHRRSAWQLLRLAESGSEADALRAGAVSPGVPSTGSS
ncbi:T6SS immunity protein Tli4 family protein [Massilia sp. DD77]|uniref:T6SS immunity protein Tli4 family protein n=1 Tax=Massilia sp. DD77 TaxID=3109349 RepID=UPI002FFED1B6